MSLALFDFDGTITTKDSLTDFIQFSVGKKSYYKGLLILSPLLFTYSLKLIPNNIAKEKLIAHFFKGWDVTKFEEIAAKYSLEKIDAITRPKAINKILWHKKQGHKIVIVSASIDLWLKPWCEKHNIDLIATSLEFKNSQFTGKFASKNCHGIEKVNRIHEVYRLSDFDTVYAYGDSSGDKQMLSIAGKPYFKPFR